jgi:hypothetical protein
MAPNVLEGSRVGPTLRPLGAAQLARTDARAPPPGARGYRDPAGFGATGAARPSQSRTAARYDAVPRCRRPGARRLRAGLGCLAAGAKARRWRSARSTAPSWRSGAGESGRPSSWRPVARCSIGGHGTWRRPIVTPSSDGRFRRAVVASPSESRRFRPGTASNHACGQAARPLLWLRPVTASLGHLELTCVPLPPSSVSSYLPAAASCPHASPPATSMGAMMAGATSPRTRPVAP